MEKTNDADGMQDLPEIKQLLREITELMAAMTKEERIAWFKQTSYSPPVEFVREMDGTVYIVRSLFDPDAGENIPEKVERILSKPSPEGIEEGRKI